MQSRPVLSHGDGIYVTDARGKRYIDGPGGMWCSQIGYNRREIADAIADQALKLSYNSPWYTVNGPSAQLAQRIAAVTPGDLNHIFFTGGGSTAVDSALRFVQFYNNVLGRPRKKTILCRWDGYHGSTHLTAACSGRVGNRPNFDLDSDTISFLTAPNNYRRPDGVSEEGFLQFLLDEAEERIRNIGPDRVAAILAEPIQASGGVIVPPEGYLKGMRQLSERYDLLFISDEVVTGFGRCGHWFASEAVFGVRPDIITFAKGVTSGYVPLGGFAVSDAILARISGEAAKGSYFSNGYTYTGHPVSCAAALANMDIMERENILKHVREIAPYFQERLHRLKRFRLTGDVRGVGLLGCVECTLGEAGKDRPGIEQKLGAMIDKHCHDMGLIVRPIGNMCVFSPPLIISKAQIDEMMGILARAIQLTEAELS
jgi:adenosylmethionine-8-amino-7-oxononanoate aminotransferase